MTWNETLYARLPAVYRRRDAEQGEPLRALLAIIEEQFRAIEADIETTWDNWFVETAEEWLVPYLGEALGLPVARNVTAIAFSRRAFVANAIRYRRAKGTAAAVELLARDLTKPTRVVEFFTRLAWTEAINHQTGRPATLDIRSTVALERLGGPFSEAMRTVEVRRIASGRGMWNLPNLGLFMWRTQLWPLAGVDAEEMGVPGMSAWWFQPAGGARPLYAALETEVDPAAIASEASVPLALSRRRLWEQARRLGAAMEWPFSIAVHGDDGTDPVVRPVPAPAIDVCNLETLPAAVPGDRVLVDPQHGSLVLGADFTAGLTNVAVVTDHLIATPGRIGAGPWSRDTDAHDWLRSWTGGAEARQVGFQVLVRRDGGTGPDVVATLDAALQAWDAFLTALPDDDARSRALGLILVGDSRTHGAPVPTAVRMPAGAVLGIVAARWPERPDPDGGPATVRLHGDFTADEVRPLVRADLRVRGEAGGAAGRGELYIDGLWIDGAVRVEAGALQGLHLRSTTVRGAPGIDIDAADGANAGLVVTLERSILRGVAASGAFAGLVVRDTAVTGPVEAPLTGMEATGSTVLGATSVHRLDATDCVFDGLVTADEQQDGCVRFSYVPPESRTPRRFRCQPDLAVEEAAGDADAAAAARLRVRPQFVSRDPQAAGFLLLAPAAPAEIRGGAEDGGEPGCWNHLQHGIRAANLANALPQFLRFGLEPGIFFLV